MLNKSIKAEWSLRRIQSPLIVRENYRYVSRVEGEDRVV